MRVLQGVSSLLMHYLRREREPTTILHINCKTNRTGDVQCLSGGRAVKSLFIRADGISRLCAAGALARRPGASRQTGGLLAQHVFEMCLLSGEQFDSVCFAFHHARVRFLVPNLHNGIRLAAGGGGGGGGRRCFGALVLGLMVLREGLGRAPRTFPALPVRRARPCAMQHHAAARSHG